MLMVNKVSVVDQEAVGAAGLAETDFKFLLFKGNFHLTQDCRSLIKPKIALKLTSRKVQIGLAGFKSKKLNSHSLSEISNPN